MKTQFIIPPSCWASRLLVVCVLLFAITTTVWAQAPVATPCPAGSVPTTLRPQPGWVATSSGDFNPSFAASNIIDGNTNSAWASTNVPPLSQAPRWVQIDLGSPTPVAGIMMVPRRDNETNQGLIHNYLVQLSLDNVNWTTPVNSTWTYTPATGQWNVGAPKTVLFNGNSYNARYVRLAAFSGQTTYASVAELSILQCNPPAPVVTMNCNNFNLLNSGTNAAGTAKSAVGGFDRNWDVAFVSGGLGGSPTNPTLADVTRWTPAMVSGKIQPIWDGSPFGNAEWISASSSSLDYDQTFTGPAAPGSANNDYFFRYRFNLSDPYQLAAFRVQMDFLADNSVYNAYVNGVSQTGKVAGLPQTTGNSYWYGGFNSVNRAQLNLPFDWQLGVNELVIHIKSGPGANGFLAQNVTFCAGLDFGDAPSTYGITKAQLGAGHIVKSDINGNVLLRMGNLLDAEADGTASANASNDDITGLDDEDGVTFSPICEGATTITATVNVYNTNTTGAKIYGWIDLNQSGTFEPNEAATPIATNVSGNYVLTWTGVSGLTPGTTLMSRFRLTSDPNISVNTPNNPAFDGEVEDYQVTVKPLLTLTANISSQTICSGSPVTINYTPSETAQVRWVRMPGTISGFGNVDDVLTATAPTTYTYTAQTVGGTCPSNVVVTTITVNPVPILTPSTCSQTICSGQAGNITFVSSVPGSTINWLRVEDNLAGTGDISEVMNTAGNFTYKIWATSPAPASCPSSTTITCEVVVNECTNPCSLTVTASASSTAVCVGGSVTLAATVTPAGSYTYTWSGPNGFTSNQPNPVVTNVQTDAESGSALFTVTVTDATGCSASYSVPVVVNRPSVTISSNSPLCVGNTLTISASGGMSSYSWSGPNGFVSNQQNPSIPNATTAVSGSYTLVVSDALSCTASFVTSVTISQQPSLTVTAGPGLTICSGQSTTLAVSGNNGAPVIWSNSLGQSGTGTSIPFEGLRTVNSQPISVTYVIESAVGFCGDRKEVVVTINPEPVLQVVPSAAVYCDIENVNITATTTSPTATINWTRTPTTPGTASGSGVGAVTIQESLPVANYVYTFTATGPNGCSTSAVTTTVTVQQ